MPIVWWLAALHAVHMLKSTPLTCSALSILVVVFRSPSFAWWIRDVGVRVIDPQNVIEPVKHGVLWLHQVIVRSLQVTDVFLINTFVVDVEENLIGEEEMKDLPSSLHEKKMWPFHEKITEDNKRTKKKPTKKTEAVQIKITTVQGMKTVSQNL